MIGKRRARVRSFTVGAAAAVAAATVLLQPGAASTDEVLVRPVAATSDACGATLTKADGTQWECTFVDEFDGGDGRRGKGRETAVDADQWLVGDTSWSGFYAGSTCLTDSRHNVSVRRGTLRLTARDEGREFTCKTPRGEFTTRYTGGHIASTQRFAQTYGRFEVRARYPDSQQQGLHAAFWLFPEDPAYGAWPKSGEIDVAEWWSTAPDLVLPSLHYPGRGYWTDSGWWCRPGVASEYHTYAVEWTEAEMRFYQDGRMCFQRAWQPTAPLVAPQPFDQPFNLVLTMAVGQRSGHNAVTAQTELPATFEVDYVKAWQ